MAEKGKWVGAIVAALALVAVGAVVAWSQKPPEGPQQVFWDRDTCALCLMHIGVPAFAAQLHTREGDVLHFDDPGCLFRYRETKRPEIHALYFRHHKEDRWLSGTEVAFVATSPTPMGYELGAVDGGTPDSLTLEEAALQVHRGGESRPGRSERGPNR